MGQETFPPSRQVYPTKLQQTSCLKGASKAINPKILVDAPVLEVGIDILGLPVSFHVGGLRKTLPGFLNPLAIFPGP